MNAKNDPPLKKENKEVNEKIRELYAEGMSPKKIMEIVDRSEAQVYKVTEDLREKKENYYFPKNKGLEEEVCRLYEEKGNATEIGRQFGYSHKAISRVLKENGIKIFAYRQRHFSKQEEDEICRLWKDEDVSVGELRERYRTSLGTIKRVLRENGEDPDLRKNMKEKNHFWKGGRKINARGYVEVYADRNHPFYEMVPQHAGAKYFLEHRLVMAEHLGRPLTKDETVHHINGIRDDNRIENLQLRQLYHGEGQKWECADCGSCNIIPVELD